MRIGILSVIFTSLLLGQVWAAETAAPSSAAGVTSPSTEDTLKAIRNDLQGQRADIMAKNITLTAEQASKFWPAYTKFQEEQNVIFDEQLKAAKKYVDGYATMDDAAALAHANGFLERDLKMNALQKKWLLEFQKILPIKTAARVIQVDRRLSYVQQLSITSQIPLIH